MWSKQVKQCKAKPLKGAARQSRASSGLSTALVLVLLCFPERLWCPPHPIHRLCFSNRRLLDSATWEDPIVWPFRAKPWMWTGGLRTPLYANKPAPSQVTAPSKPTRQLTWSLAVWLGHRGPVPLSLLLHSAAGFLDELLPQTQKFRKPPRLLLPLGSQEGLQVSEGVSRDSLCILEDTEVPSGDGLPFSFPKPLKAAAGLGVTGISAGASGRGAEHYSRASRLLKARWARTRGPQQSTHSRMVPRGCAPVRRHQAYRLRWDMPLHHPTESYSGETAACCFLYPQALSLCWTHCPPWLTRFENINCKKTKPGTLPKPTGTCLGFRHPPRAREKSFKIRKKWFNQV